MTASNRSEIFGRLLKAGIASIANCEGKTAPVIEDELGAQIGVAGKSIQRYKAGYLPPEARTVQILAEACVKRGMMGREWLEAFLHHARYHQADKLLDQLRPLGPARPRPPRIYENLPAPTYSQFVMRPQAFAEVVDGLQQRSAAVLIVGLGGNGKTSLAREVAARCLRDDEEAPRFDAVVWVSDKDRPGTTNLSIVLDEIARTLDYPGFTQFEHDEKRREVEQLLRRQRVLLVVDNFETITDSALLSWLLRLPEPSKVIVTTREYWREFRRGGWPVELRGMSEAEAWELITERARVLKTERLVDDRAQLEPFLAATGGNPKAITMTLGLVKYERRPLNQVVDDLYAARGELFDDLFMRAWALLDEAARRVLLVATFFPISASSEALSASADVGGYAFDRAVERLADLALLDVQQADLNSSPRYALHPLVRAFAGARLAVQPEIEVYSRPRWFEYYLSFLESKLKREKPREPYWNYLVSSDNVSGVNAEWDNLRQVLQWAEQNSQFELLLKMTMRTVHYMDWNAQYTLRVHYVKCAIEAANILGHKWEEAILHINALGWTFMMEGRYDEAEFQIGKGLERTQELDQTSIETKDLIVLAKTQLADIYLSRGFVAEAEMLLTEAMSIECRSIIRYRVLRTAGKLAYYQGDYEATLKLYKDAIRVATESDGTSHNLYYERGLACLAMGDLTQAKTLFRSALTPLTKHRPLRRATASYGLGLVSKAEGDIAAAYHFAKEAIDALSQAQVRHYLTPTIRKFLMDLEHLAADSVSNTQ